MGLLPFRHRRNGVFTLTDTLALLQSLSFEKRTNVNYSHIETHLKEEVGGGRDWARFFRLDGRRRSFTLGRLHRVKIGKQTNCWSILLFLFPPTNSVLINWCMYLPGHCWSTEWTRPWSHLPSRPPVVFEQTAVSINCNYHGDGRKQLSGRRISCVGTKRCRWVMNDCVAHALKTTLERRYNPSNNICELETTLR